MFKKSMAAVLIFVFSSVVFAQEEVSKGKYDIFLKSHWQKPSSTAPAEFMAEYNQLNKEFDEDAEKVGLIKDGMFRNSQWVDAGDFKTLDEVEVSTKARIAKLKDLGRRSGWASYWEHRNYPGLGRVLEMDQFQWEREELEVPTTPTTCWDKLLRDQDVFLRAIQQDREFLAKFLKARERTNKRKHK